VDDHGAERGAGLVLATRFLPPLADCSGVRPAIPSEQISL
jgi:hypothetical protein